jgi:diaminopimelate epimerase
MIEFFKYQGTGNDFIIIDCRHGINPIEFTQYIVRKLCDRRFGIGADGLILVVEGQELTYKMIYFNSDGNESTMCGNGGRCFAAYLTSKDKLIGKIRFEAIDGHHEAILIGDNKVELSMMEPIIYEQTPESIWLNTGSPHLVFQTNEPVENLDLITEGCKYRYADQYKPDGLNVNFVQKKENSYLLRTYERGVEAETLSCGTGATAAAISIALWNNLENEIRIDLETPGGQLEVVLYKESGKITNVRLIGKAELVFKGYISL